MLAITRVTSMLNFDHPDNIGSSEYRAIHDCITNAIKDFQEFWAESIEIYFKSPDRLQLHYPELYTVLCDLLNQDPLNYPHYLFEKA